jgi:membrane-associated phospholipid phosphatase
MTRPVRARRSDRFFARLSRAADHGGLWLAVGTALVAVGGRWRRAGLRGIVALAITSAVVNGPLKWLFRRERPQKLDRSRVQLVRPPRTSSFPSGHAATAFGFATAATSDVPELAAPLGLLAAGVAYSRVRLGVHHTSDVLAGAAVGAAVAVATREVMQRRDRARHGGLEPPLIAARDFARTT